MERGSANRTPHVDGQKAAATVEETAQDGTTPPLSSTVTAHRQQQQDVPISVPWSQFSGKETSRVHGAQSSASVQSQGSAGQNRKRTKNVSKKRKTSRVERPWIEKSNEVAHWGNVVRLPFPGTWMNSTVAASNNVRNSQICPLSIHGSESQPKQNGLSSNRPVHIKPQARRPAASLPTIQQLLGQYQDAPNATVSSETLPCVLPPIDPSSLHSSSQDSQPFQSFEEYQHWACQNESPIDLSQKQESHPRPPKWHSSSPARGIIARLPTDELFTSIHHQRVQEAYDATQPGYFPQPVRSMEEHQHYLHARNGIPGSQNQNTTQPPAFRPYNSPYPPLMPCQPNDSSTSDIQRRLIHAVRPSSSATGGLRAPNTPVFKKPAIPAHARPIQQSFLGINQILPAVMDTLALAKAEVNTTLYKPDLKAPGLAGRGSRLSLIHAQAKVAGCEYFLAELNKPIPKILQELEDETNPENGYRLQLSVNLMQIGVKTEDLIAVIKRQLQDGKNELAIRINNVAVAEKNVDDPGNNELVDMYRAWTVEVADHAARAFFLQRCLDGLHPGFSQWEEKARIEELTLPPR